MTGRRRAEIRLRRDAATLMLPDVWTMARRLRVGHGPLEPRILVRIQARQPHAPISPSPSRRAGRSRDTRPRRTGDTGATGWERPSPSPGAVGYELVSSHVMERGADRRGEVRPQPHPEDQ